MNPGLFKIQITNPCANEWEAMSTSSEGRFCADCAKNVIDFSSSTDAEIKAYMLAKKGESICGRFQKQQVDRIRIEIDRDILRSGIPSWQKFLVVFLICFGSDFLGVDFCFAQTVQDSTVVQIEQPVDSTIVEATEPDTTVCVGEPTTGFQWQNQVVMLGGAVNIVQVLTITDVMGDFIVVDPEAETEETVSLIDTLLGDTTTVAAIPTNGFTSAHPKPMAPKKVPERQPQFVVVEEKRRRKRKKAKAE